MRRRQPTRERHDLAQRQPLFAPPLDVGRVAEGAHHEDAGALLGIGLLARKDGHGSAEERRHRPAAEEVAVALVLGMSRDADAGGEQLGARGGDHEGLVRALHAELDVVVGARLHAVFELRLGDGTLEVDVPERGRVTALDVALGEQVEEGVLGDATTAVVDGLVLVSPVDGEPEPVPQLLEGLLVLLGHALAGRDEVGPRDLTRRLLAQLGGGLLECEVGVVGGARVATDVEEVLDPALGGEPVVVPAHGIEDVAARHPHVAGEDVGVGVAEDVARVECARSSGRRGVDDEGLGAGPCRVVVVGTAALPLCVPAGLGCGRVEVAGKLARVDRQEISPGLGHLDASTARPGGGWLLSISHAGWAAPRSAWQPAAATLIPWKRFHGRRAHGRRLRADAGSGSEPSSDLAPRGHCGGTRLG
jgi:hypothetical protein